MGDKGALRGRSGEGAGRHSMMGGRALAGAPTVNSARQRQRGWSRLAEPGLGAAGSAGRPRAPRGRLGSPSVPQARAAPRVIYDPLSLPGGGSSGGGPRARGTTSSDGAAEAQQAGGGGTSAEQRRGCGHRPHLRSPGVRPDLKARQAILAPKFCLSGLWLQCEKCRGMCGPRCQTRTQVDKLE